MRLPLLSLRLDDFIYENVNVSGEIEKLSASPDYAVIRIAGGQTVLQHVASVDDIAVFPPCVTVLSVTSTVDAYLVTVFVNDPAAVSASTFRVKEGVIRAYWGSKRNVEKEVSIVVKSTVPAGEPISLWPAHNTVFVRDAVFQYDVSALLQNECMVDASSFSGVNVDVLAVAVEDGVATLTGKLVDEEKPASLKFVGYTPDSCTVAAYPAPRSAMVVKEVVPSYSISYKFSTPGCTEVEVVFNAPVVQLGEESKPLTVTSSFGLPVEETTTVHTNPMGQFLSIASTLCISGDNDNLSVNVDPAVVVAPSQQPIAMSEPVTIFVSKMSLVVSLKSDFSANLKQGVYVMKEPVFTLEFDTPSPIPLDSCDFSQAVSSDYLVELSTASVNGNLHVSATVNSIDHHTIVFDASKVTCEGSFTVEFLTTEFKFAYDPKFVPGDILVTRVNSYYYPEFDFVPLRKVYTWDKIFFTDEGWVYINDLGFFVDHGSDGCISWTPKSDVEAGTVQKWTYQGMTYSLDRSIPRVVDTEYSFNYEKHGFLLDFQDNLFVYATDQHDLDSRYDSTDIQFIFGVYWSSSEWAPRNSTYMEITAEYSALPDELTYYSVALGTQAQPIPRGVNYMAIKQENFETYTNSYYHMLSKIIDKSNWETSQKDRFTMSPQVSYMERPMDFTYAVETESVVSVCLRFVTPYTIEWDMDKIALTFNDAPVSVGVYATDFEGRASACIVAERPSEEGEMRLSLAKGAFKYTTQTIVPPFSYESERFVTAFTVFNVPALSFDFDTTLLLQTVRVASSVPCASWKQAVVDQFVVLKQEPSELVLAFRAEAEKNRLTLPAGLCSTRGAMESVEMVSEPVTATPSPDLDTMLKNVHFEVMKSNEAGMVQLRMTVPSAWTVSETLPTLGGEEAVSVERSEDEVVVTFDRTTPVGECGCMHCECAEAFNTLVIPGGFLTHGQERSVRSAGLVWDYFNQSIEVLEHVDLPWKERVTREAVYDAVFHLGFAPDEGSRMPADLLRFSGSCASLGYVMGPEVATTLPLAIMHGFCSYGADEGAIRDSYGNTNAEAAAVEEFDFLPPVGMAGLVETVESAEEEFVPRLYWNQDPVLVLFFDEPLVDFDESVALVTCDRCAVEFFAHNVTDDKSRVTYLLHDCEEAAITLSVVPGVVLRDEDGNECVSEQCIQNLPLVFEKDVTIPTIAIATESSIIYGNAIDIAYTISEPETTFSCESIGLAVEDVTVTISAVGENVCHYEFTPLPVNGTRILFFVPEGRFADKAGNPNAASNTLMPLALNKGAEIVVSAPEYTSDVQTEFQVTIGYTWLCTNYEHIFPSTFEYDRDVARIEKTGSVVDEEGVITQTFVITFFNFEVFPEERYKAMPIHIPSMVCSNPLGIHNNPVVFHVTFDNTPTEPAFDMTISGEEEKQFNVNIDFADVKAFGALEAAEYVFVTYENDDALECAVSREVVENKHRYAVACPLNEEGNVFVTIQRGAVVEMTGVPSSNFTRAFYIDASPPTVTLTPRATTFGPEVSRVEVAVTVSDLMSMMPKSCFVFENTEGLTTDVVLPESTIMSNVVIGVTMARTSPAITRGSFSLYVKEHCSYDLHNNWNLRSNVITLDYDFVAPEVTLSCPKEDTVLNTITIAGSFNEPCRFLTPSNIRAPSACVVRDIDMVSSTAFTFTMSCYTEGRFEFAVENYKDVVGNVGARSAPCAASFTISGPSIKSTVRNLIKEQYVNTASFEIDLTAAPNCDYMNLTSSFFVVQNAEDVVTRQISACHWTMTGKNVEEGNVFIRVMDNAAVDVYGGMSLSHFIQFSSYQSKPVVMSVSPSRFAAHSDSTVMVCYDWNVERGLGGLTTEGACSAATVKRMENNCAVIDVTLTEGPRCFLHLEEDFVKTQWELSSEARYLFLDVDDQPPVVDATMSVNEREVAAVDRVFRVNSNGKVNVVIPAEVSVYLTLLEYSTPECLASIETEQRDEVVISLAFSSDVCSVELRFAAGFFKDSFSRSSPATTYTVSYNAQPLVVELAAAQYHKETPIVVCASFSKPTVLAAENVMTTVPVTVSHSEACENLIELAPEETGDFMVNLVGVKDVFGNELPIIAPLPLSFYKEQPVAEPVAPVTVSTLVSRTTKTVSFVFDHKMAMPPATIEELFAVVTPAGAKVEDVLELNDVAVANNVIDVTFTPRPSTAAFVEYTLALESTAFVDLAGNTVAPTTFVVVLDNQPATVTAVTVNGDRFFSAFPVTLTVAFSKPIVPVGDFFSRITASINDAAIAFTSDAQFAEPVQTLTVTSTSAAEFAKGDALSVSVGAGVGSDEFGMVSQSGGAVLTASNGASMLTRTTLSNNKIRLVFDMKILSVNQEKIEATNVVIEQIAIDGETVDLTIRVPLQGAWSLTMGVGAIVGSDESDESAAFTIDGVWDTVNPTVDCVVPAAIGEGRVSVTCTFTKAVATESDFFKVMRDDVVLNHAEEWKDGQLVVSFVGIESRVEGYTGVVSMTLDSCHDAVMNACLPVLFTIPINFKQPALTFDAASIYVHQNMTSQFVLAADQFIVTPITKEMIEVTASELGMATVVDLTVYEEGYKWLVSVLFENMEMTDYVPFTLTFAANQVSDAVGNRNSEAVFNVVMKDSQPSLRAAVSGRADADLTLTATFTNGPVSELAREAIDMSDNVELTTIAVKEATETTTVYELHLVSKCTVSCEYWVHFKAESIYDDAGNRLAEDVMVNEAFPMMPVLRYQEDALCGEKSCLVTITSSENIDMDCKDVEVETEGYAFVPNLCLNTKECVCQLTTAQETVALTRVTYKVGANVAFNSYHVGNAASEPLHLWHATERLVPVIASAWKEGDGIKDIAFSASWGMDMDMTPAMFHCKNCEIHDWEKGETFAYAFKVSFFDENDRYAVVSVPEGAAVDPFGRATAAGEFVLRREAVAPRVVRFRATGSAKTTVLLEFSKDVKPCGGEIALTSDRMPQYNYRIATSSSAVKTNGRIVELEAALLSDAAYTVSFTSNAFCDESSYPMDVECTMCAFRTAKGVPVAPKTLEVTRVMARSVEVAYAEGYNGGDQVLSMTVSTFPASALPPVVVTYPAMEGSVRVEGLEPNTEYALFVVFTNSFGDSFPSTLTFTTSAGTPKSATDLRVCDVIDPTTVGKNSYVYTRAKACWTPSVTPSVTYVLHVLPLDHEGMEETTIAVETPFAEFAVGNDVTQYRLTLETVSALPVEEGVPSVSVSAEFVTAVDLEQIYKFPQGAGIKVVAERLSSEQSFITFTHPMENYFKIERYLVQYGNVFEDVFDATNNAIESLPFRMEQCTGNAVTVTVRAGVLNGFYGHQSNRVTVYCKKPRLVLRADAGFNFVSFLVASEVESTAVCTLKANYAAGVLATQSIHVSPAKTETNLFKSLEPDTEYTIACEGYDRDFAPVSGRVTFSTTSDFELPSLTLGAAEDATVGASFVEIPIENVNMPGSVYCMAAPIEKSISFSRGRMMHDGFSTYVYPQADAMKVLVSGLKRATHYHALCIFEPDFASAMTPVARRLADQTFEFTTAVAPEPAWVEFAPVRSGVVPINAEIVLTARLPIVHTTQPVYLRCAGCPEFDQVMTNIVTKGNKAIVRPASKLQPGKEYTVVVPMGAFVDVETRFPMPAVRESDKVSFIVTSDATMITAPSVVQTVPEDGSVTDLVSMKVAFTFDRDIVLGEGATYMTVDGESVEALRVEASGRKLTLSNTVYFDEGVEVRVFLPAGYVCNAFGACNAERITLQFQVGAHNFEPSLIQMTPANGAQRVFANEDVEFVFNKLIKLDPAFQMVFTDETGHSVVFSYAEEASKTMGRLSVAENKLIVSGSMLPAGHTYNVFFDPELIMDYQGRVARGLPKTYSFTYSEYPCSGNYIYEDMGDECSCFLTSSTCECHCGKEETPDAVMIRLQL